MYSSLPVIPALEGRDRNPRMSRLAYQQVLGLTDDPVSVNKVVLDDSQHQPLASI